MPAKPVIAYLSSADPHDKKVWSGTHYSMFRSLQQIADVKVTGPYEPKLAMLLGAIINQVLVRTSGKRFDYRHSRLVAKAYGRYFTKKINALHPDLIVAAAASTELAQLQTTVPIIYLTDGTFAGCLNYHKVLSNLVGFSTKQGNAIELAAITKSKYVVVASQWAAQSVINDYKKNKEQVVVIPYGANFEALPESSSKVVSLKPFKLLFVGVYWQSKGGDIAYRAFRILKEKGFEVTLTVMGCEPPADCNREDMEVIPFIDKNKPEGQQKMKAVYADHHLLLLPTRFDCSPIVINEASAFGLPCLVADTGGVAGHLKQDKNGYLLPYKDKGEGYARRVEELMGDSIKYQSLRHTARQEYESVLNWQHWLQQMQAIISSCFSTNT